ncbi:MAG: YebC/PmpR family DNA-binding transcriptional regulator [Dehalococcoidia bacterium]|nr:YebC/PmpR family DNA-binding transcriptional regulator [Dehalococcoidia bacterium]MDW8120109.1 YebC/PmpR family DNA-binding transcriptional regulator [Chloroflexota bacterium]
MAGHSKWAQIKHQKMAADARRGQLFTKLAREITIAARQGGGDVQTNPRLRLAVERAREANMPMENIQRAIRRGTGQGEEQTRLEEVVYEGYGPGGIAILVQAVTENRNRTVSEIRSVLERGGGKMGGVGSVSWLFEQKGVLTLEEPNPRRAESIALEAIDLGAEDFVLDGSFLEVRCPPERFEALRKALEEKGITFASAELALVPKTTVPLDPATSEQVVRLLDRLEDLDDVQKVYTNADFPNEVLEGYRAA